MPIPPILRQEVITRSILPAREDTTKKNNSNELLFFVKSIVYFASVIACLKAINAWIGVGSTPYAIAR